MTLKQVTDVTNGKRVLAPPAEIREVKNAYEAYDQLQKLNMYSVKDLLKAHKFFIMSLNLFIRLLTETDEQEDYGIH